MKKKMAMTYHGQNKFTFPGIINYSVMEWSILTLYKEDNCYNGEEVTMLVNE